MSKQGKHLLGLPTDAQILCLSYLTISELVSFRELNRSCDNIVRHDTIWKEFLRHIFGIIDYEAPPGFCGSEFYSSWDCFVAWRMHFPRYRLTDIRRVRGWWKTFHDWCDIYAPSIKSTLRAPASESDIDLIESQIGKKIPSALRLFYRFHDGQQIPFDDDDEPSQRNLQTLTMGMFGGTYYYNSLVNMRFIPLKDAVSLSASFRDGRRCASLPCIETFASGDPFSHTSSPIERISLADCIIFAKSAPELDKIYCVSPESAQGGGGGGNVYVNTGTNQRGREGRKEGRAINM